MSIIVKNIKLDGTTPTKIFINTEHGKEQLLFNRGRCKTFHD